MKFGKVFTLWLTAYGIQQVESFAPLTGVSSPQRVAAAARLDELDSSVAPSSEKRTLYDILQVNKDATREEMKKQYRILARQTHPDANTGGVDTTAQFAEIAEAWKTLSDKKYRQRYDRTLRAEEIQVTIEEAAARGMEEVSPKVKQVVDAAFPFLRRTTVTTVASVSAAVDGFKRKGAGVDVAGAVLSGIRAGRAAGQIVDGMELFDKAIELEKRAEQEKEKSIAIQAQLMDVMNKRLNIALRIPNSGITSSEALKLLDGLNIIDSVSFYDRLNLRHTIEYEIGRLQKAETEYLEKADLIAQNVAETEWLTREAIKEASMMAAGGEEEVNLTELFTELDRDEKRLQNDLLRVQDIVELKQEKVRLLLLRKDRLVAEQRGETNDPLKDITPADLEYLEKKENYLMEEKSNIEKLTSRLFSRAQKLKERAEDMQNLEQGAE